ncbi:MAG: transcriptional regulator [Pseudonocardiales bacterium]|nr:transcriptional regulator [Pseudonocardiales bacterium]
MSDLAQSTMNGDAPGRAQVSDLYGLFTVSMMMFGERDGAAIMRLCTSSFPSLGSLRVEAAYLNEADSIVPVDIGRDAPGSLASQVADAGPQGGRMDVDGSPWGWAMPLISPSGCRGYLAVSAPEEPQKYEHFLLDVLARQTAAALENAALYREVAQYTGSLRAMNEERAAVNRQLRATVQDLERRTRMHEMLTEASRAADVPAALVEALRDLTGLAAAVEDAFGNVQEWAGPEGLDKYKRLSSPVRDEIGHAAIARAGHAVRTKGRLLALARPGNETLGAVVLADPRRVAGDYESFVLEHAAVVLGMELAHRRSLVEVELRLRRQLVDDLVSGTDDSDNAVVRAAAVGHDLTVPHRAVVIRWSGLADDELLASSVERVITQLGLKSLIARRSRTVVLLVTGDPPAKHLYDRICRELHSVTGAVGIGGRANASGDLPRSFEEAKHALAIRAKSRSPHGVTTFEDLGIYRILAVGEQGGEIDAYVTHWLGSLIEYDATRHSTLVETLAEYLDHGGNYDLTAEALVIHRSTLRYRLRRIRELTGFDLADVESRLNLHVATRAWRILDGA